MESEKELIVVIETGSWVVSGAAGRKRPDGTLEVVAYASEPSGEFIRNGVVRNIDRTAQCLTNIINMLEGDLKKYSINKIYVGIGGYTLHTVPTKVERGFEEDTHVTTEIIESMIVEQEECIDNDKKTVIEVIPQEYKVDNLVTGDPVGYNCRHIVGEYINLIARFSIMNNLAKAFEMAKLEDTDNLVTPLRLAEAILTPTERNLGCTLVDIGADCTTVSIYKGGRLRFLSVIPLGDRLITADLATLGIGEEEAERIKQTIGLTTTYSDEATYRVESGNDIKLKNISMVIRARMQEILVNVSNQVMLSGYSDDKLSSGYIFTGGALEIPNAETYIRNQKVKVFPSIRIATLNENVRWTAAKRPSISKQLVIAALIAAGEDNCVSINHDVPLEIDYTNSELKTGNLFDEDGESAQDERDRRNAQRQAEKAQRQAEARAIQLQKAAAKASKQKGESWIKKMRRMRDKLTDMINEN
ncbi:MAG: cell division protein FtsA [Bacteroidaceae bacterium]|nr:cell division protein FtsA [Bacteroidaceae bacterium]